MNNFLFETRTKVLFGGGCVQEYLGSFVKGYGPSVLLVTEEGDCCSGAADEVRDILRRSGKTAAECAAGTCGRTSANCRAWWIYRLFRWALWPPIWKPGPSAGPRD